jgi:glutathione S-transferase
MPSEAKVIATVRMVQMVTITELWLPMIRLTSEVMDFVKNDTEKLEKARQQVLTVLNFFESKLDDSPYFGSNHLTLADITAGTLVTQLPSIGVPLENYPKLSAWCNRLMQRDSWKATEPSPEAIEASIPQAKTLMRGYLT